MERQLTLGAYWIGLGSTVAALVTRVLAMFGYFSALPSPAGNTPISYRTFFEGAELFFLMAIAGSVLMWARTSKT